MALENLDSKLRIYDLLKINKLILKFTRNNKKEQNVFAIFTINYCLNKFDFAFRSNRKARAMVGDAYLDIAACDSGFWKRSRPAEEKYLGF